MRSVTALNLKLTLFTWRWEDRTTPGRPHPESTVATPVAHLSYARVPRDVMKKLSDEWLHPGVLMTWSKPICEGSRMTADDARFIEVYERFHRHVYGYCRRRVSADQVDDVVADTFLTAWRRIDQVPSGDECLPWLYAVAYRVLSHQWRGSSRRLRLNEKLANLGATSIDPLEEYIVMRDESRLVLDALANLKPTDQEILRLATWEELAQREIALALGISPGAVRQRLYEAKKNLTREYTKLEKKRIKSPAARKGGAWWQQKNV